MGQEIARIAPAAPTTVADLQRMGTLLAASGYFKDARDMAQAAVKIQAGAELGIPPVAAMSSIYIVEGKPTLSAVLMGALVKRSQRYNYRVTEHTDTKCTIAFFEASVTTRVHEQIGVSSFSLEDARSAGVTRNPVWSKYPRNMLFARAMSNGCRWYCPDVFGGPIYTPEELGEQRVNADGDVESLARSAPLSIADGPSVLPKTVVVVETQQEPQPMGETELRQAITRELDRLQIQGTARKDTVNEVLGHRPVIVDDLRVVLQTLSEYPTPKEQ